MDDLKNVFLVLLSVICLLFSWEKNIQIANQNMANPNYTMSFIVGELSSHVP